MIALALELSSPRCSVAVLSGEGQCAARRSWQAEGRGVGRAVGAAREVLSEAGLAVRDVERFVAGRGPGAYSGIRIALTVARSLALPFGRPAAAADSGSVLADAVLEEAGVDSVAVVGDARRGRLWVGVFERTDPERRPRGGWRLVDPAQWMEAVRADLAVSSEWERVRALLPGEPGPGRWIQEPRYPDAARLAQLVLRRENAGFKPDPLTPLYLHPAVAAGP